VDGSSSGAARERGGAFAVTISDKPITHYFSRETRLPATPSGARIEAGVPALWLWLAVLLTTFVAAFLLLTGI